MFSDVTGLTSSSLSPTPVFNLPLVYKPNQLRPNSPITHLPNPIIPAMSYASATSRNLPADQPIPDPALLNTTKSTASGVADDTTKVGVVSPNFKENPATTTSTFQPLRFDEEESDSSPHRRTAKTKAKGRKLARDAEKEAIHWSAVAKELVLRPPVAGGLVGVGEFSP